MIKREFSKIRSKVVIFFPITTGIVLILAIASPLISLRSNKIVFIIPFRNINEKTAKNEIIFFWKRKGNKEASIAQEKEIETFLPKKTFFSLKSFISIL